MEIYVDMYQRNSEHGGSIGFLLGKGVASGKTHNPPAICRGLGSE